MADGPTMKTPRDARALLAAGRAMEAIEVLRDHLAAQPEDAQAWDDVTEAMLWVGDGRGAVPAARNAWVLTRSTEAASLMAIALAQADRAPDAIKVIQSTLAERPNSAKTWERLARALELLGAHDSALDARWQAYVRSPRDPELTARVADRLERGGRRKDARRLATKVLEADPKHPMAQRVVVRLELHEGQLERASERARKLLLDGDLPASAVSGLWKDLARIEAARGAVGDAFMAATVGNAQALLAWSTAAGGAPHRMLDEARRMLEVDVGMLPTQKERPEMSFVVTYPCPARRDLRERFEAHPHVVTIEDPVLEIALDRVLPNLDGGLWLEQLADPAVADRVREAWWDEVQVRVDPTDKHVVDAGPTNLLRIDIISRVFPGAAVIGLVRDPRDAVLDAFLADFDGTEITAPLADLHASCELLQKLHALWFRAKQNLPNWLEVRYEDIDRAPRAFLAPVFERLGLRWDDAVYDPPDGADLSVVGAVSFGAMRPPRRYSSIGRWPDYAEHLEPILDDIEPTVRALGYALEVDAKVEEPVS